MLKHGPKKSGNTNDMIKDPTINSAMRKINSDSTPAIEKLARKPKREEWNLNFILMAGCYELGRR
jgi:hypothetical protein